MKTYSPKPRDIERRWYVIDASGAILGRLASEAAAILRGKHKPIFAPHMDTGDHVIVVNAKEVRLTGGKEDKKIAYRHSGYPGGLTETRYSRLMEQRPHWAVEKAIKGMLPKNRLGRAMGKKLQVYPGPDHPHQAQKPQPLKLGEVPRWEGLPVRAPRAAAAPEPKAASRTESKPSTGERTAVRSAAKKTTAKRAAKTTARSTAKSSAKATTAKKTTARSTATTTSAKSSAKATTAKSPAKKTTARRSLRRKKKEE
jgi:large subunit ribosomal protein L13